MAAIIPFLLTNWRYFAIGAGALAAIGFLWHLDDSIYSRGYAAAKAECQEGAIQARLQAEQLAHERDLISDRAALAAAQHQVKIQTITRTIIKEVPAHVTPKADAACALTRGFVRVHDAAAAGVPTAEVPNPAGQSDDSSAGIALSAAASTIADNYGADHANAQQLEDLQSWVRMQQSQ